MDSQSGGRFHAGCPFADSRSDGCICIALKEPKRVSVDYQARFCLTDRHVQCRRFQRAVPEIPEPSGIRLWSGEFELKTFLVAGAIAFALLLLATAFTFRGTWAGWFTDQSQPAQAFAAAGRQSAPVVLTAQTTHGANAAATPPTGTNVDVTATPAIPVLAATSTPPSSPAVTPTATPVPTTTPQADQPASTPSPVAATPATTPVASTELATPTSHVVVQGETLTSIGQTYGVSAALVAAANDLGVTDALTSGTNLFIPNPDGRLPSSAPILGVHLVAAGDNLASIAGSFNVDVQTVMAANGIANANHIEVGQIIRIPKGNASKPAATPAPRTTYTVKPGDTLYSVSKQFGVTIDALMAANGLTDRSYIQSGQVLVIPAS